ncbi:hypothetical protein [Endozoicomonas arenosclerae]|uniref:hypothetical protein n=1 Tax=Endozoicomonas arenosclerae TaxID=1633495 RepID=UPI0007804C41|nr:hypothetical protein [Endozoicomonas arenosclerae]
MDDLDQLPEDIALAIEIIRQLENLNYQPETVLQAMMHVCKDSLGKLPERERENWKARLAAELER